MKRLTLSTLFLCFLVASLIGCGDNTRFVEKICLKDVNGQAVQVPCEERK